MRILLVNNLYPPYSRGGGETVVVNEAATLRALGHEVAVFTTAPFRGPRSLSLAESKEDGVTVFRFFPFNLFWYRNDGKHGTVLRALWYVLNIVGLHQVMIFKKAVKKFKPDVIHLHNINGISYRLPKLCDKLKIKTVFTLHAVHYAVPSGVIVRGEAPSKMFLPFAAFMRKMLSSKASVTAPSEWLLDFYTGRGFFKGQNISVIPNPLSSLPSITTGDAPRATCRFLSVGQLEQYKGVNTMLSAVNALSENGNWHLDLVGAGSMQDELRRRRDRSVRLRGRLLGDELVAAFREASVFVMPSLCEENAPMVIAEALSYGLPVIASAVGGVGEMIEDGKTGVLVRAGNVDDLALAMRRAILHPEVFAAMRPACLEAAKRYAPDKVVGQYLKLFRR